jgi:hypothetical protein
LDFRFWILDFGEDTGLEIGAFGLGSGIGLIPQVQHPQSKIPNLKSKTLLSAP